MMAVMGNDGRDFLSLPLWIPAYAGMTGKDAGMTMWDRRNDEMCVGVTDGEVSCYCC